jgi:hypothetical protein
VRLKLTKSGTSPQALLCGESKQHNARSLNLDEDYALDTAKFAAWVKQASRLPGETDVAASFIGWVKRQAP